MEKKEPVEPQELMTLKSRWFVHFRIANRLLQLLTAVTQIALPDGTTYVFNYDQGTAAGNYGELQSVQLPTGGTPLRLGTVSYRPPLATFP
jgi:hypothetical protein